VPDFFYKWERANKGVVFKEAMAGGAEIIPGVEMNETFTQDRPVAERLAKLLEWMFSRVDPADLKPSRDA
jgi:hypothetical protein